MTRELSALERSLPQRSLEQRVTQEPISFRLGGEPIALRVLTIGETRQLKQYVTQKLGVIAGSKLDGDALVELITRFVRDGVDEQLDLVLRYDVDETIPGREIDDAAGLYRSSWVDEHATELELEEAFLAVATVVLPFGRRLRSLLAGQDWTALLKSLRELQSQSSATTRRSQSSTS